ncbi:MAG: tRNA lysidine(34) synthetase TilS [Bacteroidales bacterium]|nr:tRNA lysidine(34) synthetase TilS [Bacteroidales bacterium]
MAALDIIGKVRAFFLEHPVGDNLLLAVSGGADSSVMAHLVHSLYRDSEKRIGVAHVNFHLRGEDSNSDQAFVKDLSQRYGFEFFTADFDTLAYAREHKLSVEIAARELRYGWFRELAEKEGFQTLLTAHNADDNAETLLLNLARGTGRQGLGAIRPFGLLQDGICVARPLLNVERFEIEAYAKENNLSFCIDKTNSQSEYSRNKIRNLVMPYLKEINPSVIQTLNKDISRFKELNAEVDKLVAAKVESLLVKTERPKGGIVDALREKYLVFRASAERLHSEENTGFYLAELLRIHNIPLNEDELEQIADGLCTNNDSTRVFFLNSNAATIERGELRLYSLFEDNIQPVEITGPGVYSFGPLTIRIQEQDVSSLEAFSGKVSVLDADKVSFPLFCRTMREGDRFSPFGLRGSKSVADFLNSRKVDLLLKNILPVVAKKDGSIVCLPSLEIDDRYKVTSQSKKALIVSAQVC